MVLSTLPHLTPRDYALLTLLAKTPLTAGQIRKVSVILPGEPFRDERRVRERLSALQAAGLITLQSLALTGGGAMHLYRLTREGWRACVSEGKDATRFAGTEVAVSRLAHTLRTAEVLVHTLVAAQLSLIRVLQWHGDGQLVLAISEYRQVPDAHFQLEQSGQIYNILFEIDNATEPIDSLREQSIRTKILGYELYQDWVMQRWHQSATVGPRPGFRVVFLTKSQTRAEHILWFARSLAKNPDRRLCYTSTQDAYLGEPQALTVPFLNDHHGGWQSLANRTPTSQVIRTPLRLTPPVAQISGVC